MDIELPPQAKKGRGAVSTPMGRFERYATRAVDDGWSGYAKASPDRQAGQSPQDESETSRPGPDEFEHKFKTNLHIDTSRSVINEIDSPDLYQMRSINPYRGCEHGCIYCFARPSHGFLGYSSGLDFESEIFYKPDAPEILRKELAAKNYAVKPITLGSNTDCYQPVERELKLTRRILEVLAECRHPVAIITKSALVTRDIDLLAPMAAQGLANVYVSLTTLDPELARLMEPRAAAPYRRLATMKKLADAGIPVTAMTAPLIPALNDMEVEKLLGAAYEAGAREAHYGLVKLPYEVKDLFKEWLETHRPERAAHVLSMIRQTRGGKLYDADYSQRSRGTGVYAELMARRFKLARKRIGYNLEHKDLRCDLFRPPERNGQIELFR